MSDAHGSGKTAEAQRVIGRPFEKGQSGNPGGRPALPAWFREFGPQALMHLRDIARGKDDAGEPVADPKISRGQACDMVASRIYGLAPKAPEDRDDETAWQALLARIAGAQPPPKDGA